MDWKTIMTTSDEENFEKKKEFIKEEAIKELSKNGAKGNHESAWKNFVKNKLFRITNFSKIDRIQKIEETEKEDWINKLKNAEKEQKNNRIK